MMVIYLQDGYVELKNLEGDFQRRHRAKEQDSANGSLGSHNDAHSNNHILIGWALHEPVYDQTALHVG